MILNKNKSLEPIFVQNLRQERLLISLNAVVCYLRCALFFNLKKRTMKGRWVKYLLMGTVVAMLAACSSKPTDRGQQYKDGNLPSLSLW